MFWNSLSARNKINPNFRCYCNCVWSLGPKVLEQNLMGGCRLIANVTNLATRQPSGSTTHNTADIGCEMHCK